MRRARPTARLVYALSLAALPVRAAVDDGTLGSRCTEDDDCAAGLGCLVPPEGPSAPPGPAGGLCTAPCTSDGQCSRLQAWSACRNGLCLEACLIDVAPDELRGQLKCHERDDVACVVAECMGALCRTSVDVCAPLCGADERCGAGLFCNPASGLCQTNPAAGDPPGSPCDYYATENTCRGYCDVDPLATAKAGAIVGGCVEPCTLDAEFACGGPNGEGRACLGGFGAKIEGHAPVDLGVCVDLCDCDADCNEGRICSRVELGDRAKAAGICAPGVRSASGSACLNEGGQGGGPADCPYGPLRACQTAACIGTATCRANGTYSPCECLDAGAAGGPPTGRKPAGPVVSAGCSAVTLPQRRGASWLATVGFVAGVLRRRRARKS
jgi:hypothetical protein